MATVTKGFTFTNGATIVASEHNSNFDTIYNEFNGNIENANIKAGAGIADTKLANITTANKVSGAAFTALANVPSGAGYLPLANITGVAVTGANSTITAITGLTTPLAINQGGTATTATAYCNLTTNVTGTLPTANGGTNSTATTYCNLTTNVGGILPTANGGTGSAATTYCNLTTNVGGVLPRANGGTGISYKMLTINTYTGNGNDDRTVAHGLGDTPDIIFIMEYTATGNSTEMVVRHNSSGANTSYALSGGAFTDGIKSFDGTNATLGVNARVNANAKTFFIIALKTQ